jgi:penicillin-binding protein 2
MAETKRQLNEYDSTQFEQRFKIAIVVILIGLYILVFRMWHLQVIRGPELAQRSENNSIRLRKINVSRGLIIDRNGIIIADNQPSFDLMFLPHRAKDSRFVFEQFKKLYINRKLAIPSNLSLPAESNPFIPVRIEKNISREKLAVVETNALDLPGVVVQVVPVRKYPGGETIAHLVGYTGEISREELKREQFRNYSEGDSIGKFGLEKYLDADLRGKDGAEQIEVNALGKEVRVLGRIEPIAGHNVVLTIDFRLQQIAAKALEGKTGSVIAMDPRDGSVLALVSAPSFDPNLFNGGISYEQWDKLSADPLHPMENRAVTGQFPPGSTYKMIVAAAALQEGLIREDTKFFCPGFINVGNRTFRCWQKHGHGMVNLHRAIVESCDVYFYNLGRLLDVDKLAYYARHFGFGIPTGIDLSREKAGIVPTKQWKLNKFGEPWQLGETMSIVIGQGFDLVTPIQLLNAYSALANGGTLYRPRIVDRIETSDGRVIKKFMPQPRWRIPISAANMEILKYGLWGAVNERGGTGYALKRKEADVCGKTGTAQVVGLPEDEKLRRARYVSGHLKDHALFVCFAPYNKPEIAVVVIAEHAGHGGAAAAPVARKIIDAYFELKNMRTPQDLVALGKKQDTTEVFR